MRRTRQWTSSPRPPPVDEAEKLAIIIACEALIRDVLKPRHLPRMTPTQCNHVVDIHGAWGAGRYRFMQRYRSGMPENAGEEFNVPFARLDRMGLASFDIQWMRHTGTWWRLHSGVTLTRALYLLENDGVLQPP